jgi:copper(I)-binding protein
MLAALRGYLLAGCLALAVWAVDAHAIFIVNQPWVRPAAQGRSTEVYMDLTSTKGRRVAARSDRRGKIRSRKKRRRRRTFAASGGAMIRLAPGGNRVVLSKLARPIKLGDG